MSMGRAGIPWPLESYLSMTEDQLSKWEASVDYVSEIANKKLEELLKRKRT